MIVQESRIKTRSGHQAVSRHVLSGQKNEAIRILSGSDYLLRDWMKEARREDIRYGLRHIAFNPAVSMTDEQLASFAERICTELSADPSRITLVIHKKDGSTHGHLLLPEWQEDHVLSSRFSWQRLEKIARLEEIRLGHALVAGRHDHAIAKALRAEGHHDAADRIAALAPEDRSARPVAAYTSQARRMAERQDFDLPTARREILSFWQTSDNDLTVFRNLLATKNWRMRWGDRTDGRRDTHIIETQDGMLIGSFTRLTKVRMKDFREFLEKEGSTAKSTGKPLKLSSPSKAAKTPEPSSPPENAQIVPLKRTGHTPKILSWSEPDRLPDGFRRYLEDWQKDFRASQAVLKKKHPLEDKRFLSVDEQADRLMQDIATLRRKLNTAGQEFVAARDRLNEARALRWQVFQKKRLSQDEEQLRQAAANLGEILRYLIEYILYRLGLTTRPPAALELPVPDEREQARRAVLHARHEMLAVLSNKDKCRDLLKEYAWKAEQKRRKVILDWYADHQPARQAAEQRMERLRDVWQPPASVSKEIKASIAMHKRRGDLQATLKELEQSKSQREVILHAQSNPQRLSAPLSP
ncbi:hypothetical protein [Acetobacter orientalis]|uniref:hypothetical protein n=1 Tax=Acetobacter orientalis TaxID=146474 RepID=UPI00211AFF02|nr:hypothetical protein [Acetobacter orientalis]